MRNVGFGHDSPSQSTWCNAVVLVRKKDGSPCFCIDFWCLNTHRKKDSYPLPRIQEALESLVGAGHFSYLDLNSGFWQIKMDESSKQYTASTVGNLGFFECDHMPFWLCNSPTTFQQLMQNCLGELNLIYCFIYLDDIVIFSHTAEEHLHCLCVVFDWFREHNLKLKPLKCNFFKEEITYLAHWVSKDGVQPSYLNLKAIVECALPQTYTGVHAFLGLVVHYLRFIKGFAHIAWPLNEHLTGEGASRKSEQVSLRGCLESFWGAETSLYGRWAISSHHLWQQSTQAPWEKLPFNKAWVLGTKMGGNRTFQGILALSTFPGKDRQ